MLFLNFKSTSAKLLSLTKSLNKYSNQEKRKKSKFLNNTALVTGASNGIGLECVKYLLQDGVKNIVMSDIAVEKGEEEMCKLQKIHRNSNIVFFKCDVADCEDMKHLFNKANDCFGYIDIVVNNAGIYDEESWAKMIDINLKSVVCGSLLGFEHMRKDRCGSGGTIVNVSSILGLDPMAAAPVYAATKHAIIGHTRCWGHPIHYCKTGVRVMALCPGLTETPLVVQAREQVKTNASPQMKEWERESSEWKLQHVCHTGLCLIQMLKEGDSGSVWVVEGGEIYEVCAPNRTALKLC